jgi:tetratricopeptide (TPR) repeat protein
MSSIVSVIKSWFLSPKSSLDKKVRLSFWEKYKNHDEYINALELRIIERAEKDVNKGYLKKAIDRYEGFFKNYPNNQIIHDNVALLYLQIGDKINAGRHFYLTETYSTEKIECMTEFERAYGNSPTLIMKNIINKHNFRISELNVQAKLKLKKLVEDSIIETGITPKFLRGIKAHLDK